ncbi:MAG: hypothetical protein ABSF87_14105 [Xanthobacteraceae bacterium]|jgi:hypothetical protein
MRQAIRSITGFFAQFGPPGRLQYSGECGLDLVAVIEAQRGRRGVASDG